MIQIRVLLLALFFMWSCTDQNEEPQTDNVLEPVLSIKGLEDDQKIWGVIDIRFTVNGVSEIERLEIFLDNSQIATLTGNYEFELVTTDFGDGQHIFKAQAIDVTNNRSNEIILDLEFTNQLLKVEIGDDYLDDGEDNFLFLTDLQNNVLGIEEIQNGSTFTFIRPQLFEDELFHYHILSADGTFFKLNSYHNHSESTLNLLASDYTPYDKGNVLGKSRLSFINIPVHDLYFGYASDRFFEESQATNPSSEFSLFENAKDYYVYLKNGSVGYYLEGTDLKVGINTIDLDKLSSEMDLFTVETNSPISTFTVAATDIRVIGGRAKPYFLFQYNPNKKEAVSFHLPSDRAHLNNFHSILSYFHNGMNYNSSITCEQDFLAPSPINATIEVQSFQLDNIILISDGQYDELKISTRSEFDGKYFYWNVRTHEDYPNFDKFPTIPSELQDIHASLTKENFGAFTNATLLLRQNIELNSEVRQVSVQVDF